MARPKKLTTLVSKYLEIRKQQGLMPSTLVTYHSELNHFTRWLAASERDTIKSFNSLTIDEYLLHLRRIQYRMPGRVSTLRCFGDWLLNQGYISSNPLECVRLHSKRVSIPAPVLTADEVKTVLESIPETLIGIRDRAMLEVLFSSGLRRAELMNLRLNDVDAQRGLLIVRQGKGLKNRFVPIGEQALYWLDRYIREARPESYCPNIFLSKRKKPIGATAVLECCKKRVKEAGVHKKGNTHAWRHAAATALLEGGAGLRHVQAFLGHESIETTVLYTRVSVKKLQEVHRRTHPFEVNAPED